MCIYITRLYIILALPFCNFESKYAFYLFSKFLHGLKSTNVQNMVNIGTPCLQKLPLTYMLLLAKEKE